MIRLENVLKRSLQDVLKTSWRRLQNVLNKSWRCLEDVLKTSWRRLEDVLKTSWKRLEDVLKTYDQDEYIGLDQDVLKTSWRRLLKTYELGEYIRLDQDVSKTSWRRPLKTKTKDVFKTSSRRLHQDECLLGRICCVWRHSSYWKANMSWVRDCIFFLIFYAVDLLKHYFKLLVGILL